MGEVEPEIRKPEFRTSPLITLSRTGKEIGNKKNRIVEITLQNARTLEK